MSAQYRTRRGTIDNTLTELSDLTSKKLDVPVCEPQRCSESSTDNFHDFEEEFAIIQVPIVEDDPPNHDYDTLSYASEEIVPSRSIESSSTQSLFSAEALSRRTNPRKSELFGTISPMEADFAAMPLGSSSSDSDDDDEGNIVPPLKPVSSFSESPSSSPTSSAPSTPAQHPRGPRIGNGIPMLPVGALLRCADVWRGLSWRTALSLDRWCALPMRRPIPPPGVDAPLPPAPSSVLLSTIHASAATAPLLRSQLHALVPHPVHTHPGLLACPFLPASALPPGYSAAVASPHAVGDVPRVREAYQRLLAASVHACRVSYAWLLHRYDRASAPDAGAADPLVNRAQGEWDSELSSRALRALINKDLARTQAGKALFKLPRVQRLLFRVLYVWALEHPEVGYKQGMNEILGMVVLALHADLAVDTAGEIGPHVQLVVGALADPEPEEVAVCGSVVRVDRFEADCYAFFCRLMGSVAAFYTPTEYPATGARRRDAAGSPGRATPLDVLDYRRVLLGDAVADLAAAAGDEDDDATGPQTVLGLKMRFVQHVLLRRLDPVLHAHFEACGVFAQLYLLRWFRLLFSREFAPPVALRVWDFLLEFSCMAGLEYARRVRVLVAEGVVPQPPLPSAAGAFYDGQAAYTGVAGVGEVDTLMRTGMLALPAGAAPPRTRGDIFAESDDDDEEDEAAPAGVAARPAEDLCEDPGLAVATDYLALALLLHRRDALLAADESTLLSALLDTPPDVDVAVLCSTAVNLFKAAIIDTCDHSHADVNARPPAPAPRPSRLLTGVGAGNQGFFTAVSPSPDAAADAHTPLSPSPVPLEAASADEALPSPSPVPAEAPADAAEPASDADASASAAVSRAGRRGPMERMLGLVNRVRGRDAAPEGPPTPSAGYASACTESPISSYAAPAPAPRVPAVQVRSAPLILHLSPAEIRAHFTKHDRLDRDPDARHFPPAVSVFGYQLHPDDGFSSPSSRARTALTSSAAQGYLIKLGGGAGLFGFRNLKRRYFSLHGFALRYYRSHAAMAAAQPQKRGFIDLRGRLVFAGDAARRCIVIGPRTIQFDHAQVEQRAAPAPALPVDSHLAGLADHTREEAYHHADGPTAAEVDLALLTRLGLAGEEDFEPGRTYHLFAHDDLSHAQWLGLLKRGADVADRGLLKQPTR